jgi:hypothetical protein
MYQFKSLKLSNKDFIWWNIYYLFLAKIPNKKRKEIQETNIKNSWRLERKCPFSRTHKPQKKGKEKRKKMKCPWKLKVQVKNIEMGKLTK